VSLGGATLTCGKAPAWLYVNARTGCYVAGYHGRRRTHLTLTVPGGSVEIASMGTGTVVWDNGALTVEAIGLEGQPVVK
jgi:hypothetical protein